MYNKSKEAVDTLAKPVASILVNYLLVDVLQSARCYCTQQFIYMALQTSQLECIIWK